MKRSESQPGPSGLKSGIKRARKQLYTAQQVVDMFDDLSEVDCDNDYSDSELEVESD